MAKIASRKVQSIVIAGSMQIAGVTRTYLDLSADWVKQSHLELELTHMGGLCVGVKYTHRGMRYESLVSCQQILFEAVPWAPQATETEKTLPKPKEAGLDSPGP